jgi:hypothetical protein
MATSGWGRHAAARQEHRLQDELHSTRTLRTALRPSRNCISRRPSLSIEMAARSLSS